MKSGTLYIVATPIGNLEDITLRALRVLGTEVQYVYCEDTRQTRKLLGHFHIGIPALPLHAHSSEKSLQGAIERLKTGSSIAYLTDSGTPAVSDPASLLVNRARAAGVSVVPVPGPSALTALVSVCGFPPAPVHFAGFLSRREGRRRRELELLRELRAIIVIYESPHRIKKLLKSLNEVFPRADMVIGREMTKVYEEFIHGTVGEIYEKPDIPVQKGEFTVAVYSSGKEGRAPSD